METSKVTLQFQLCFYPFFDGGFYVTGPHGALNRMVRVSLGVIDFRIWWDDRRHFKPDLISSPPPPPHLKYLTQSPPSMLERGSGYYFGASSGNTAEFCIVTAWENQPSDEDISEVVKFARTAGPPEMTKGAN